MRFDARRRKSRLLPVDMTPMIDIVFQLLIFFLTTAQLAQFSRAEMDLPEEASRIFDRCLELCRRLAQPEPLTLVAGGSVTVAQPDGPELGGGPLELGPESGRAAGSSLRLPCTGVLRGTPFASGWRAR